MSAPIPNFDFSPYIGKKWETEVTEAQIKEFTKAEEVRVLTPTSPMTMDLRIDRCNVFVEEGNIIQITMG